VTATNEPTTDYRPPRPALVAWAVFTVVTLTLCWPMFAGKFLAGPYSDMFEAGYSFRAFAASYFRTYHAIPQWNPYLMGGVPYIAAGAGDIFYPTAWLRWILPTDVAINLGFAAHLVIAGGAMYGLARVLRVSWTGALVAGLAYELTGIVASQVHPGHDGKLFVSALAPVLFTGLVLAIRDRRVLGYALIALATGLSLHAHPQASYYLLVGGAIWGLFWGFSPEGPTGAARLKVAAATVGAVALGVGLYAIYLLPLSSYIPFSPRADAGYNSGWAHAISYALPRAEVLGVILPKIYGGVTPGYFGSNGFRAHSEYLGPVTLLLAVAGAVGGERRRVRLALAVVAALFLLVSLGGDTPFYRLWYSVMPMMKKVRAAGMAFFMVALPVALFAGFGAERLARGIARIRLPLVAAAVFGLLGLLAAGGVLQNVAMNIALNPGYAGAAERAAANAADLRLDGIRVLVFTLIGAGLVVALARGWLRAAGAAGALALAVTADLWIEVRPLFEFSPGKSIGADDEITARIRQTKLPYRVWEPAGDRLGGAAAYPRSWLMSREIPSLFGYHGNELRFFDDLFGGKNEWPNQVNPGLLRLYGVQFAITNQAVQLPEFHQLIGPVTTAAGTPGFLYQADSAAPYARVYAGAARVPDGQLAATVADPRFPIDRLVVYPDTASVTPAPAGGGVPAPSPVSASVVEWRPGLIRVALAGQAPDDQYLVVAENWYGDWHATVDGRPAPVLRGQASLLSVRLPPGAKEARFEYDSAAYRRGRLVSLASALGILLLLGRPLAGRGRRTDG
jgi:hypothetical protein